MSESKEPAGSGARRLFLKNAAVAGAATGLSGVVGDPLAQTISMRATGLMLNWHDEAQGTTS
jgi:hypothetical protein